MKSATAEMSDTAARTVDRATTGAHDVIDRATEAARPAINTFAEGAHHAVDKLAVAASRAADTIDTRSGQLRDAQMRLADRCLTQVREQPATSLGIAVATGVVLGWLISRG